MKRILSTIIGLVALCSLTSCDYNSLVEQQQAVDQSWAEVENQYQRRADLIPNLVSTVKGYAQHESSTLENVVEARSKATSITIDADDLNEETLKKFQAAQNELSGALKQLIAVAENYPDLKANENFRDLQVALEGTENRIATARGRYTQAVMDYNTAIRKFPTLIYAGWFGFEKKPQFTAAEGAETAPKVEF